MDFYKIIKTKTIKVNHSNFNKIKLQLKPVAVRVNFINNTEHVSGYDFQLTIGINNSKFIESILLKEKIDKKSVDEVINFLSQFYNLDLSKKTLSW
jgi:hypothetical protein